MIDFMLEESLDLSVLLLEGGIQLDSGADVLFLKTLELGRWRSWGRLSSDGLGADRSGGWLPSGKFVVGASRAWSGIAGSSTCLAALS